MLHTEAVDAVVLDLLRGLQGAGSAFADLRLVGGTALALQIGHRKSVDLGFFGHLPLPPAEVALALRTYGPVTVRAQGARIQSYAVADVLVDLVDYPYPWLDPPVESAGLRLASCRDIAAMKLAAITNRGTRKDFIDLAFLLEAFTLAEMLAFYEGKFADGSRFAVCKSLSYFDDADADPMPPMLRPCTWSDAKQRVAAAVAGLP